MTFIYLWTSFHRFFNVRKTKMDVFLKKKLKYCFNFINVEIISWERKEIIIIRKKGGGRTNMQFVS